MSAVTVFVRLEKQQRADVIRRLSASLGSTEGPLKLFGPSQHYCISGLKGGHSITFFIIDTYEKMNQIKNKLLNKTFIWNIGDKRYIFGIFPEVGIFRSLLTIGGLQILEQDGA